LKKTRLYFEVTSRETGPKPATFDDNEEVSVIIWVEIFWLLEIMLK
jgi:hypothetical protein